MKPTAEFTTTTAFKSLFFMPSSSPTSKLSSEFDSLCLSHRQQELQLRASNLLREREFLTRFQQNATRSPSPPQSAPSCNSAPASTDTSPHLDYNGCPLSIGDSVRLRTTGRTGSIGDSAVITSLGRSLVGIRLRHTHTPTHRKSSNLIRLNSA